MSHSSLTAAADERKARLLQLKSLKRKAPTSFDEDQPPPSRTPSPPPPPSIAQLHLSGRNYDPETKGPKLGFENPPIEALQKPTLEEEAAAIEKEIREKREEEERKAQELGLGGGLDLEQLRPKKPNWDLKRDLDRKMQVLGVRTDNAIAKIVRERIEGAKARAREKGIKDGEGEGAGMDGINLVESVRQMEREDEDDNRRFGEDVDME